VRRLPLALVPLACLVLLRPGAGDAQSSLPPCEPSKNGRLVKSELTDPEPLHGSHALYATHRLQADLGAINEAQDPDFTRYEVLPDSEQLAPGPGVVGKRAYVGEAPGLVNLAALWTVTRGPFGYEKEPYCTGSGSIAATLRKPSPTSLAVQRRVTDLSGDEPRVKIAIAGRPSDDLRPVTVRMRRGARGAARELFTIPLADVSAHASPFRFRKRFAGVTVRTAAGDARFDALAVAVLSVWMPKVRDGHHVTRSFTVEVVREGRVLVRVRAVIACHGRHLVGIPSAFQECSAPTWRVTRPRS
jgi:hypothetical protein